MIIWRISGHFHKSNKNYVIRIHNVQHRTAISSKFEFPLSQACSVGVHAGVVNSAPAAFQLSCTTTSWTCELSDFAKPFVGTSRSHEISVAAFSERGRFTVKVLENLRFAGKVRWFSLKCIWGKLKNYHANIRAVIENRYSEYSGKVRTLVSHLF